MLDVYAKSDNCDVCCCGRGGGLYARAAGAVVAKCGGKGGGLNVAKEPVMGPSGGDLMEVGGGAFGVAWLSLSPKTWS